ncbi:MAG: ETC complex I subunit [Alphaproteobacteria bacterium]
MNKKAKIYKPSKSAMQSGLGKTAYWVLEYERQKPLRPDPLMGWTSSGDTLNQVRLRFESCEAAVARAEQEGLDYQILPSHERRIKPRNYSDNFRYKPVSAD